MSLDIGLIRCFLAVAEERSFSRAADRIGVTQPLVSARIRRLEDLLRLRLFDRTSRHVALSREGAAFLPQAQALIEAEERTLAAAARIRAELAETITLGSNSGMVRERLDLIDCFLNDHPASAVTVRYGSRREMRDHLRSGLVDVITAFALPDDYDAEFMVVRIGRRIGHLVVGVNDPLADRDSIALSALAGRTVIIPPDADDSAVIQTVCLRLEAAGARLLAAPEPELRSIHNFARQRDGVHLRWERTGLPRRVLGEMVVLPLAGEPVLADLVLYTRKEIPKPIVAAFLAFAATRQQAAAISH